ncbi:hypothetical protein N431DRAFT_526566 [Stipitochalara longipes BDJ]|nr:hypothetical protein N431DRAFT_526566 [Stipitochalara longipes BDJ]
MLQDTMTHTRNVQRSFGAKGLAPPERVLKLICMDMERKDHPIRKLCGGCTTREDRDFLSRSSAAQFPLLRVFDAATLGASNLRVSVLYLTMFKELVSLAIIVGFILNILYVEHPDTNSYTIAFVLSMAVFSPFALAWRYRASLSHFRAARNTGGEAEGQPFVSVSEARVSKGVEASADVELGLTQSEGIAPGPPEGT